MENNVEKIQVVPEISPKSNISAFLFCFLFGFFSGHRFYVGKWKTAILQIITAGGLTIWVLFDLIMIIAQKFTDSKGRELKW